MLSKIQSVLFSLCALLYVACSLSYSDLEALGEVACPERDKCEGYSNNLSYTERSCECDFACAAYGDCCIDKIRRRPPSRIHNLKCLNYGSDNHTGVYAISTCSSSWSGPAEVRQKCLGSPDLRDPLMAAPVTSVNRNRPSESKTYRNLFCAECNNADMESLTTFQLRMACDGLESLSDEQILADLTYHEQLGSWGVYRLNSNGDRSFVGCAIIFDVPSYLNNSVRFCRSNIISTCAPDWTRQVVRKNCDEYMAVVYDNVQAYRNPHCAICNHLTVDEVACRIGVHSRKRPMSFALLLDVNQSDGDQVGMRRVATPQCPSGYKYDPFFKRCRELVCALPGHVVVNGRCVRA